MNSVIIYTYFKSISSDYNLYFFIENEIKYRTNIDYIIVINGYNYNKFIKFPSLSNLTILFRKNIGYDFGGHNYALTHLQNNNKTYRYYFFMNSGVIGPIVVQPKHHWTITFINKITDKVKLVSTSIVCLSKNDLGGGGPKIESFFFMTDSIGIELLKNEKTIFCNHINKKSAIINGEYGLSRCIFKHGYTIDCMLDKYKKVNWLNPINHNLNNNLHPSRKNTYFNKSINPYEVIFHKWYWHNTEFVNFNIINNFVKSKIPTTNNNFYKSIYPQIQQLIFKNTNSAINPNIKLPIRRNLNTIANADLYKKLQKNKKANKNLSINLYKNIKFK
jgi:hypothetical protein